MAYFQFFSNFANIWSVSITILQSLTEYFVALAEEEKLKLTQFRPWGNEGRGEGKK